jgi:uncharacterized Zn-binding protein involved in type VI secretion
MPAIVRLGVDNSAGHCFEPRPTNTASNNVFINGIPAVRVTDYWPPHRCGKSSHDGVSATGSPNVFVNGLPVHRIGDSISCGDIAGNGSPNVFCNG